MNKAERLIQLWLLINKKKQFTAKELAQETNVSVRTIMRDLETLTLLGAPLYSNLGRGGGYSVFRSDILPPIAFTEQEILSLFFAYSILQTLSSTPFEAEINFVKDKLYQQVNGDLLNQINQMENHLRFMSANRTVNNQFLNSLLTASLNRQPLILTYDKGEQLINLSLVPIGLYAYQGFWYFVAYHFEEANYQIHRVDRIQGLRLSRRAVPEKLLSLSDWYDQGQAKKQEIEIQLQIKPAAYRKLTNQWFLNGKVEETNSEWLTLTFETMKSQTDFIVDDILKLGSDAKVLYPSAIRQKVVRKIQEMTTLYEETAHDTTVSI